VKNKSVITNIVVASGLLALAACSTQESKPAPATAPAPAPAAAPAEAKAPPEKAPEKAKATKLAGDVGLLDTEKNYLIIVSKEGKLVTIDFDPKFQPTQRAFVNAKISDIGLGSAATVQYTKQGEKNIASNVEFLPAKGE
jgi:hypothetical protein